MDLVFRNVQPREAIAQLGRRIANPIGTFSWLDVWQTEHAQMFTVAKSAGFDILGDIIAALDASVQNGTDLKAFTDQLVPILQAKGWWGKQIVRDPLTGASIEAQLGSLRRLKVIYETNMRIAFNAGRWVQAQRVKQDRPYLRYVHTTSEHPRHSHLQFVGVTLPVDHPWWKTHMPINGWGCKCSVDSLSQRQYELMRDAGEIKTAPPPIVWKPFFNKRTGQTVQVPEGIDPGFANNPGEDFLRALAA
jgi:uncharacterized protein with gpF-like domain